MIIEFLTMKITFDAIVDHLNNLAYQQGIQERVRALKSRLLQLTYDFESHAISREEFEKKESEIMREIDALIKEAANKSSSRNAISSTSQSSLGLGGLL